MGNPPDYDPILEGLRSMRFNGYMWFFQYTITPTVECVSSTNYLVKVTPHNYFNVFVQNNRATVTTSHTSTFRCSFPCAPCISPTSMQWTYLQDVIQQYL